MINWIKRRWFDFRMGHSTYLIFALAFMQFVIISYSLAIERFGFLKTLFPEIWIWASVFIAAYIPAATYVGSLHRKFQVATETIQMLLQNPYLKITTPGKEQLYNIPMGIDSIKATIASLECQNRVAAKLNLEPVPEKYINKYKRWLYVSERLVQGHDIFVIEAEARRLFDGEAS